MITSPLQNILLDAEGRAKLADFGISRVGGLGGGCSVEVPCARRRWRQHCVQGFVRVGGPLSAPGACVQQTAPCTLHPAPGR